MHEICRLECSPVECAKDEEKEDKYMLSVTCSRISRFSILPPHVKAWHYFDKSDMNCALQAICNFSILIILLYFFLLRHLLSHRQMMVQSVDAVHLTSSKEFVTVFTLVKL